MLCAETKHMNMHKKYSYTHRYSGSVVRLVSQTVIITNLMTSTREEEEVGHSFRYAEECLLLTR